MVERFIDIEKAASSILAGRTMFSVYVLRSLKNGRFYTGFTGNFSRRIIEHNSGKSLYTKLTKPFELVYVEEFVIKSEALKREKFFKTGKGRELLKSKLVERSPEATGCKFDPCRAHK